MWKGFFHENNDGWTLWSSSFSSIHVLFGKDVQVLIFFFVALITSSILCNTYSNMNENSWRWFLLRSADHHGKLITCNMSDGKYKWVGRLGNRGIFSVTENFVSYSFLYPLHNPLQRPMMFSPRWCYFNKVFAVPNQAFSSVVYGLLTWLQRFEHLQS